MILKEGLETKGVCSAEMSADESLLEMAQNILVLLSRTSNSMEGINFPTGRLLFSALSRKYTILDVPVFNFYVG